MPKVVSQEEVISVCKNKKCVPLDAYINGNIKMRFKCLIHNVEYISSYFLISSKQHASNKCPKCSKEKQRKGVKDRSLTNDGVDGRLSSIHEDKITRIGDVKGRHTKIEWKCNICGVLWKQTPGNVIHESSPTGCPGCSKNTKDTSISFNEKLKNLGRNDIKLVGIYTNSITKTKFKCNCCNSEWDARPANILNSGRGCPLCINKSEKVVGDILKKHISSEIVHNYYVKTSERRYLIDWYIPDMKIAVEYQGIQHYQPTTFGKMKTEVAKVNFENQVIRDIGLRKWCHNNNINLIEIDGRKYKFKNTDKIREFIINTLQESGVYV